MTRALIAALALLAWADRSQALEFSIESESGGRVILFASGPVESGDAARLEGVMQVAPRIDEIWLDSPGGLVAEGFALGRLIRKSGYATRVPAGAQCASACLDVFLGGMLRFADADEAIGIHTGSTAASTKEMVAKAIAEGGEQAAEEIIMIFEQRGAVSTAEWTRYVIEMGASIRLVDLASRVDFRDIHWLNKRELVDLNVVNVVD